MKKIKMLFLFIVLMLIVPTALADYVGIGGPGENWVTISEWEEIISVKDNGLEVSLALNLVIDGRNRRDDNFLFYFMPERATEKFPRNVEIKNFNVCIGRKGGHNYDYIPLNCEKNLSFYLKEKVEWYHDWDYVINVSDINEFTWIAISINYVEPIFLNKESSVKTLKLETDCFPTGEKGRCPGKKQIVKHIMLPPKTSLQEIPPGAETQSRSDGGWRITLSDFTPEEKSDDQYSDILITYIDNGKIEIDRLKALKINIFVAVCTGILSSWLVASYFYKKNKLKSKNKKYNTVCEDCGFKWNKRKNTKKCYKCKSENILGLK